MCWQSTPKGQPVQADFSFGEVDEALYSVRPDESGDIVASFYPHREASLDPVTSFAFSSSAKREPRVRCWRSLNSGLFHPRLAR